MGTLASSNAEPILVGRSSSHFTRVARIFAAELGVPHRFQAVLDLTKLEPSAYADNPALKVPVWVDDQGSLFGAENICREVARRSGQRDRVVLRGDLADRLLANAEEMALHAMSNEVTLIMSAAAGEKWPAPPKVRRSLENALTFLDAHIDRALAALPAGRRLSFFETTVFCMVRHLPFRKIMDVDAYPNLLAFAAVFEQGEGARATTFRFDAA